MSQNILILKTDRCFVFVPTAVTKNRTDLWKITPWSLVAILRRFGGMCFFHFQGLIVSQTSSEGNQAAVCCWILVQPNLQARNVGSRFFRNVGTHTMTNRALHPTRWQSTLEKLFECG
jgi:hypothetical protein